MPTCNVNVACGYDSKAMNYLASSMVHVKRIYDQPADDDGLRILVDRLWPRGMTKEGANIHRWMKAIAPSNKLRKWYAHDPAKWEELQLRYFEELDANLELVDELRAILSEGTVTLLFATKEERFNNAVALRNYLTRKAEKSS